MILKIFVSISNDKRKWSRNAWGLNAISAEPNSLKTGNPHRVCNINLNESGNSVHQNTLCMRSKLFTRCLLSDKLLGKTL